MRKIVWVCCLGAVTALACAVSAGAAQEGAKTVAAAPPLDFEMFRTKVQPIFLKKREEHARCYVCHSQGTPLRLQELSPGATTWNEEQSRKNFDTVRKFVVPGNPERSLLLLMPLAHEAGGEEFHPGGKHFMTKNDPEWKTLEAWVLGK